MEKKKYNLSVELEATNAEKTQKDIQQVAETVRKTGDEAQKAGRVVSNSLGSAVRETGDKAKTASRVVSSSLGSAFRAAGSAVKEFASASVASLKKVGSAAMSVGRGIKTGLLLPLTLASKAFGLLKGVAIGAAAGIVSAWLQVKGVLAALGPASDMQQYQIQMEVLLKDADKARKRMEELKMYAKTTNYSPQQVIQAANLMQSFGIYTFKRLQVLGDVANAFGRDISEIVTSVNYLASGRSGEALESLSRFGVTRQKLSEAGMKFAKNGSLITESKQAVDILFKYMEKQFGGMTARQAQTWKGAMTIAGGQWWDSMARGFDKALKPMTDFVNERITPAIEAIGNALASIDWRKVLAGPLKMLGGIAELIREIADPETRGQGFAHLKSLGSDLRAVFGEFMDNLVGFAAHFIENGGLNAALKLFFDTLVAGFRFGAALLKGVLYGFSDKFRSDLLAAIPGTGEREKQAESSARALAETDPAYFKRRILDAQMVLKKYGVSPLDEKGRLIPEDERSFDQNRVLKYAMMYHGSPHTRTNFNVLDTQETRERKREAYEAAYARAMGWSRDEKPNAKNYFNLSDIFGNMASDMADMKNAASGYKWQTGKLGRLAGNIGRLDDQAGSRTGSVSRLLELYRNAEPLYALGFASGGKPIDTDSGRKAQEEFNGLKGQWEAEYAKLTDDQKREYARKLREYLYGTAIPVKQDQHRAQTQTRSPSQAKNLLEPGGGAVAPPGSAVARPGSAPVPDVRNTRLRSVSAPVAVAMEEEKERRRRRTGRNNGLGSGHAVTGGRHDAVLRSRGKTRGDVLEEAVQQGGRSRGSSGKSVESAIEKGFQRGFEKLEAKIGKRIFVVV